MGKGTRYPPEATCYYDAQMGAVIRQVTGDRSIHHHPFFFVPAHDDAMRWLIFISHRTGTPQIFAEDRASGDLVQLTSRPDLNEWSIYPLHNGRGVLFTAGAAGWRLDLETLEEHMLVSFPTSNLRPDGMVGAAMGTTALSWDDHWWAVPVRTGKLSQFYVIDTSTGEQNIILEREEIGHPQFCPDDPDLILYAGTLTDRTWLVRRDGSDNRRLYQRNEEEQEWITHETWIPGARSVAFVDWPRGIRSINVDTGMESRVTSFNAWHAVCNRTGTLMVTDTNFPDRGLQLFNPRDEIGHPFTLCSPCASSVGAHWAGSFPYDNGPVHVYAPQHTHPHPSFSPDGSLVVFTSDKTGFAQVYEIRVPEDLVRDGA